MIHNIRPDKLDHEFESTRVKLSSIAIINPKKPLARSIPTTTNVTFVPMRCIETGTGKIKSGMIKQYHEVSKGHNYFQNNDILFAKITPCMENGKIALASNLTNGIGFATTEVYVVRLKNNQLLPKFYLWYLMQSSVRSAARLTMSGTAGQLRMPASFLHNLMVPVPLLEEQRRIVKKIESIFAEIDSTMIVFQNNGAESIEFKLNGLRKSILSKEIGFCVQKTHRKVKPYNINWENITLSKLAHVGTSNTLQHVNQKSLIHIGLEHMLSNLNKIKGCSDTQNVKTYRLFQKGDILYGRLRPSLNKVWIATTNGHCSTDILPLTVNPTKVLPQFLLYVMSSHQFVQKATMVSSGVGMPRIRWNVLQNFVLAVPPLAEQRIIVGKIESIFAKIDAEICNRLTQLM